MSPQRNVIIILEESSTVTMYKSQLVISKVHIFKIAKNALELSYKPVIFITWRNVIHTCEINLHKKF